MFRYLSNSLISRRLLAVIVLFSTVITLFTSAIQLYSDYRHDVDELSKEIELIKSVHLTTLTESVWTYSDYMVNTQLNSLAGLSGIEHLAILSEGKNLWQAGKQPQKSSLKAEFPLVKFFAGEDELLGTLQVTASYEEIYQHLLEKAGLILLTNGVKTFLVAAFILFVVYHLVTRHLNRLAGFVRKNDIHHLKEQFRFDRKQTQGGKADELDQLLDSFNDMRSNLDRAITDQIEVEKKAQRVQIASQAKSEFLSNMSHELRTPLNSILGFSELLAKDDAMPVAVQENLQRINRSGNHLLSLINDVLDMSKIEAGRIELEATPTDLGLLVNTVLNMLANEASHKGILLLLDPDSDFPRYVNADANKLRQVFINLLSNAIKNTESGHVTLRLKQFDIDSETVRLRFEVEDTGCGISAEDCERIFLPFEQLGGQSSKQGTGLGLALSRKFVALMEGELKVKSSLTEGSTFYAEIPLKIITDHSFVDSTLPDKQVLELIKKQQRRILVVDDEEDSRLLLKSLLEKAGFNVREADNGQQAIAAFLEWRPQFIWMDRSMPKIDGLSATQVIRSLPGGDEVKIVIITANAVIEQKNEVLETGCDDLVIKPYQSGEIFHCMATHLDIEYDYDEDNSQEIPVSVCVNSEMLEVLPVALREALFAGADDLDLEETTRICQRIREQYPDTANALIALLNDYNFAEIKALLKK